MKLVGLTTVAVGAAIAIGLAPAAQSQPEPDTAFNKRLNAHGIYGQKDYNAWIAKIACKRLHRGVDADAFESAVFIAAQLPKDSTTEQAWQFLGETINTYCPDLTPVLQRAADQR